MDLHKQSCTYRAWDLSGSPCPHGMCAIYDSEKCVEDYVSPWYHKETYKKSYSFVMFSCKGKNMWPESEKPPVEPPTVRQMLGRPKLKRRKDVDEPRKSGKLSRKGVEMTCSLCREKGHNKKGCPNKNPNVGGPRGASSSQAASSSHAAASKVLTPDLTEDYVETNAELTSTIRVCCS